jgi:cellulose biosynthesis protein BcsQ
VIEGSRPEDWNSKDWYVKFTDITQYPIAAAFPFSAGGAIHLIPAGRQDSLYSTRVTSLDWQTFYTRTGGGEFFEKLRESMCKQYDYILIDSRAGVTDAAGICTVQMPDVLVVCFVLNNHSIEGAAAVSEAVRQQRRRLPVQRPLSIFPAPMRVNYERGIEQTPDDTRVLPREVRSDPAIR